MAGGVGGAGAGWGVGVGDAGQAGDGGGCLRAVAVIAARDEEVDADGKGGDHREAKDRVSSRVTAGGGLRRGGRTFGSIRHVPRS